MQDVGKDAPGRTEMQEEPVTSRENENHESGRKGSRARTTSPVETKRKPVKRTSQRLQSKMQSVQASSTLEPYLHLPITL